MELVYTIVLVLLFVGSLGVLGWLFWKKLPQLRIMNPQTSKDSQAKRLKYDIMRQRVERAGGKQVDRISRGVFQPIGKGMQNMVRGVAGKLTAVERRYQEKQKVEGGNGLDPETVKRLLEEGQVLMDEEKWDGAEKKFIEVIGNEPKNTEAYEKLGRLYFLKKEYDLAEQTFQFLMKLSPEDPSVIASLGEVEELMGNKEQAFEYFKQAHELSPNNPKYLDFTIEAALDVGERLYAMQKVDELKKVNPENKKIEKFEERIEATSVKREK